jgi:dienelactone hydrolase
VKGDVMRNPVGRTLQFLAGALLLAGLALTAQLTRPELAPPVATRASAGQIVPTPEPFDFEPEAESLPPTDHFISGSLTLAATIYVPEGNGPFPAVLWSHGSERLLKMHSRAGQAFNQRGYVWMVPHRRGHDASPGTYILKLLHLPEPGTVEVLAPTDWTGWESDYSKLVVALQETHLEDTLAALIYLRSLPYVDVNRIAVAGCSYGGIQTILAAERNLGLRAAVPFSAATLSWGPSPDLRGRLLRAASHIQIPTLIVQAVNDYDPEPPHLLARELQDNGNAPTLYMPPFGDTAEQAHRLCTHGVGLWSPTVFAFLASAMR